jgi:hypothetical protein
MIAGIRPRSFPLPELSAAGDIQRRHMAAPEALTDYRFGESSGSVTPVTYEKRGSAYAADPKKLAVVVS